MVTLFQFMATWNDFLGPLIYLTEQRDFTLALGLQSFQRSERWYFVALLDGGVDLGCPAGVGDLLPGAKDFHRRHRDYRWKVTPSLAPLAHEFP